MTDKIIGFLNWVEAMQPEPLGEELALSIYDVTCITDDNETLTGYWCATHLKDATVEYLRNRYAWHVMEAIAHYIFAYDALQFFTEDSGIRRIAVPHIKDFKVSYQRTLAGDEKRE
jgi:hypothetical protein